MFTFTLKEYLKYMLNKICDMSQQKALYVNFWHFTIFELSKIQLNKLSNDDTQTY